MTPAQTDEIIYQVAASGSPANPGLPGTLAALLVAQARHETGNYTSAAFKEGNNAFGYTYVSGARYQLPQPGRIADNGQPLAQYATIAFSVYEIIDWIYRRQKEGKFPANLATITGPDQYAQLLKSAGYYGDTVTNYSGGLSRAWAAIADLYKTHQTTVNVLGIGLLAFLLWQIYEKVLKKP